MFQQTKPLFPLGSFFKEGFAIIADEVLIIRNNRETFYSLCLGEL